MPHLPSFIALAVLLGWLHCLCPSCERGESSVSQWLQCPPNSCLHLCAATRPRAVPPLVCCQFSGQPRAIRRAASPGLLCCRGGYSGAISSEARYPTVAPLPCRAGAPPAHTLPHPLLLWLSSIMQAHPCARLGCTAKPRRVCGLSLLRSVWQPACTMSHDGCTSCSVFSAPGGSRSSCPNRPPKRRAPAERLGALLGRQRASWSLQVRPIAACLCSPAVRCWGAAGGRGRAITR